MAYNTGNAIGSTDPRDLSDNSENFDRAVNNAASATWTDRLGKIRTSLAGQIGYIGTGTAGAIEDYAVGQELSTYNTIIRYNSEFYRPSASATLPYTTTATTPDADPNLAPIGDANLRQDLANNTASLGSDLVAKADTGETVTTALNQRVIYVGSVAEAEALSPLSGQTINLTTGEKSDIFKFDDSPLTDEVDDDPNQADYIAPSSDPTGASGAFVRQPSGVGSSKSIDSRLAYKSAPTTNMQTSTSSGLTSALGPKKGVVILGDSISHGSASGDVFINSWAALLGRAVNAKNEARSYGWMPWEEIPNPVTSENIHTVTRAGTWTLLKGSDASEFISGVGLRSVAAGNTISITVPSFMAVARVSYHQIVGGGTFTIAVNGSVVETVDTSGAFDNFASIGVNMTDNGYGVCEIVIETQDTNQVDFSGLGYFSPFADSCVNNCSDVGRALVNVSESVIQGVCENCETLVLALGHNDTASPAAQITQVIDWVIQYVNANGINLVVPDFRWSATDKFVSAELRRAAQSVNNGIYIDFPSRIADNDGTAVDTTYLTDTLELFVDVSHPNERGHAWVFEVIASEMGLGVRSKSQCLESHDYKIPLRLKNTTGVFNSNTLIGQGLSTVRRNGKSLDVEIAFQAQASGGFPAGEYVVTDAWPQRCGFTNILEGTFPAQLRYDNGALTGSLRVEVGGKMTFRSTDGTWLTPQKFTAQVTGEAV